VRNFFAIAVRRLLIVVVALFAIGAAPTIRLYLSGSVRFKDQHKASKVEGLYLFVKADRQVLASTYVDAKGQYAISFVPVRQPSFDFYYAGLGHDTTFIRSFKKFESDVMTWDIVLP
jgi:hypothetical protein